MKRVSKKQVGKDVLWKKISAERDTLLIAKYGFLMDEYTGKSLIGRKAHHHNGRNRNINTLKECRTVSWESHRYITDHNVRDVPDRLGLKAVKSSPADRRLVLDGGHGLIYPPLPPGHHLNLPGIEIGR